MGLVLATTACNRTRIPQPNAEDFKVAREALNVEDILQMLKKGDSQQAIIQEVHRRHITQKIVQAQELELSLMGAGHQLLAELKDDKNVLTEAQELAYGQLHR